MKETKYRISGRIKLTVALLTDSHNTDYAPIRASLSSCRPDIIAIAGDILVGYRPQNYELIVRSQENVLKLVETCTDIAPTFISLGNHEWMISQEDIDLLESKKVVVLDNRYVRTGDVVIGGLSSAIVTNYQHFREKQGGRYPYRPRRSHPAYMDTEAVWLQDFEDEIGYKILLSHHPEYWCLREPWLCEHPIDLVLSGHAHGGQIRVFKHGIYASGQGWLPKFTSGVHTGRYGSMVVSRGLANTTCVPRVLNEPEIVYVKVSPVGMVSSERVSPGYSG